MVRAVKTNPERWRRTPARSAGCVFLMAMAMAMAMMVCGSATAQQQPTVTADVLKRVGIDQRFDAQLPLDLTFRDQTGREVRLGQYFDGDKPVVLSLVYFQCPMLCTLTMDGLIRSLRTLELDAGADFTALTVSFDPGEGPELARAARETALARYGRPGAEQGWHFLTGQPAAIRELTETVGFRYTFDESTGQFAHAAALIVLTPGGRISRYFFGVEYPPRDFQFGLIDASGGNIGTATDHVLMLCFQYDPTTGKYGLAIMSLLRAAGLLTLLVMGGGIAWMLRRDGKRHRASPALPSGDVPQPDTS